MSDMQQSAGTQRTVLIDVDIPFGRLIMIFIKIGLAAIPAAIVVSIIFMLIGFILSAIFGNAYYFGMMGRGPSI